jgi:hypothetical protein
VTAPTEQPAEPQPEPQPEPKAPESPPWGDDFNPQRAWDLVQNLRGDKDKLKTDLDQAAKDRQELENLRKEKMTASDRALADARDEAAKQAKAAADAEYLPQIRQAKVQAIASQIVSGDKLNAFMELADTSKLLGTDGQVDETKVMGFLTAMYGTVTPTNGPRWQNSGQFTQPPPRANPGAAGAAEAQKRFGTKTP